MEARENIQEQQFIKGFNHGYLLAIHEPELAAQIVNHKNDHNQYFSGLVSGKQEHDMEIKRERVKGVSRNDTPAKTISKDKGKTK